MPETKLEFDGDASSLLRIFDMIDQRIVQTTQNVKEMMSIISGGGASDLQRAQFFSGVEQLQGLSAVQAKLQQSVATGTPVSADDLLSYAQSAMGTSDAGVRTRKIGSDQAMDLISTARKLGVDNAGMAQIAHVLETGRLPYVKGTNSLGVLQDVISSAIGSPYDQLQNPLYSQGAYGPAAQGSPSLNQFHSDNLAAFRDAQAQLVSEMQAMRSNINQFNNQTAALVGGTVAGLSTIAANGLNAYSQSLSNGGSAVPGALSGAASTFGGIAGGILGSPFGPMGIGVGAGIGSQTFGAAAHFISDRIDDRIAELSILSLPDHTAGSRYGRVASDVGRVERIGEIGDLAFTPPGYRDATERIRQAARASNPLNVGDREIAAGYATITEGLTAGGVNPYQGAGSNVLGQSGFAAAAEQFADAQQRFASGKLGSGLIGGLESQAAGAIRQAMAQAGLGREQMSEVLTRRAYTLFQNRGSDVLKEAANIYADQPETGGNLVDILSKFGPSATERYLRLQNDSGTPSVGLEELVNAASGIRGAGRSTAIGGYQARGSGLAVAQALQSEQNAISALPGGQDSLLYAQNQAQLRDASALAFQQNQAVQYGVPLTQLQTQRRLLDQLPFGGGSQYLTNALGTAALESQQITALQQYEMQRRSNGQLSEQEELALTSQIGNLQVDRATQINQAGRATLDRFPALSSGMPSADFERFNSLSMAALATSTRNPFDRNFGAPSGQIAQIQEDFVQSFGLGDMTQPRDRFASLNPGGGGFTSDGAGEGFAMLGGLLSQILSALQGNGGAGGGRRPSEMADRAAGYQAGYGVDTNRFYGND